MEYNEMHEIRDLLKSCYVNMIAETLKEEVKAKIDEIEKDMAAYDRWIEKKIQEEANGNK